MKKVLVLMLGILLLTGCGASNADENKAKARETDRVGYSITLNGVEMMVGDEFSKVSSKLGKDYQYQEVETCAFEGMDKIYTYPDYEIYNYHEDGVEKIYTITLSTENVATDEGIRVGDTISDVISKYGDDYEDVAGAYTYTKGDTLLTFIFDEEAVTSIEYKIQLEGVEEGE